jgi:hypothetical protein
VTASHAAKPIRYTFHVNLIGPELHVGASTCAPCSTVVVGRYMQAMHCSVHTSPSIRAFSPWDLNSTGIDLESRDRAQLPVFLERSLDCTSSNRTHSTSKHAAIPPASKWLRSIPETTDRSVLSGFPLSTCLRSACPPFVWRMTLMPSLNVPSIRPGATVTVKFRLGCPIQCSTPDSAGCSSSCPGYDADQWHQIGECGCMATAPTGRCFSFIWLSMPMCPLPWPCNTWA